MNPQGAFMTKDMQTSRGEGARGDASSDYGPMGVDAGIR